MGRTWIPFVLTILSTRVYVITYTQRLSYTSLSV